MVTLTKGRVIEVSPIPEWLKTNLLKILESDRSVYVRNEVMVQACFPLMKWYMEEAEEIGEERAFWGLVYRLLAVPTKDDVRLIRRLVNDVKWDFYDNGDEPQLHRWIVLDGWEMPLPASPNGH
jgi:hypothetical protein